MPIYKIADIISDIRPKFLTFEKNAKNYEYSGNEPAQIKLAVKEDFLREKYNENMLFSIGELECIFMSDVFNKKILKYNAIFLHSSAILYKGKAYLFSADSGVGKSTHTKLWIKKFGAENEQIINDDKPIIRFIDNDWYVYGSPFDGGTGININIRAKLGGIIFLEGQRRTVLKSLTKTVFFQEYIKIRLNFLLMMNMRDIC